MFSEIDHEFQVIGKNETTPEVDVTKCIHADTFKKLNATHIGEKLICSNDASATEGLTPKLRFGRPKLLVPSDDCCHFVWELAIKESTGRD